jgi:hypothetical protein
MLDSSGAWLGDRARATDDPDMASFPRRPSASRALRAAPLLVVAALTSAPGVAAAAATPRAGATPAAAGRFWTRPVSPRARLDPRSHRLVGSLLSTVRTTTAERRPPWMSIQTCANRVYTVPRRQAISRVALDRPEGAGNASLRAALSRVPIPRDAVASDCPDRVIIVNQPSTNRMWELWHAERVKGHWHAEWGGATRHASSNDGSFGPSDWPGAQPFWGVSASSMTLLGGMIRPVELRRGRIDHAVALSLPQVAADVWAAPAERSDGALHGPLAIPYGARFRLDPRVNVDALPLPPATKAIARAAQRYGLVVREQTHYCIVFNAEAPKNSDGANPYTRLLGGGVGPALANFPWSHLQLLRMHLRHRPS